MVEALLLDGFGTVFEDDQEAWLAVARLVADDAEADAGQVLEYWSRAYAAQLPNAWGDTFRTQHELVLSTLSATLAEFESGLRPYDLVAPLYHRWQNAPVLPGVGEVLRQVKVPVAVVSNSDTDALWHTLSHAGLRPLVVVTSQEAVAYKPNAWVFQLALRKLGLDAGQVLYVGASYEADIVGAQRVGIPAVWLNPDGRRAPGPVRQISQLSDVLGYL